MSRKPPSLDEQAALYARWGKGTFSTVEESVSYHHAKHGRGMTRWEYLRKAATFSRVGARKMIGRDGDKYLRESGEFLIESDGKILSYGPPRS